MKDIEEALKRATAQPALERPAARAVPEPLKMGEPMVKLASEPHGLAAMASAPPPPSFGRLSGELKVLSADLDGFRTRFGGRTKQASHLDGAYRSLRTQVLDAMRASGARVVGITSPSEAAGKSVTAINLALAIARQDEQIVYLADFDFRRPSIAHYLSASDFPDSTGFFQGEGRLESYLRRSEKGNLRFLLTHESSEWSAEFLASSKMVDALGAMTREPNSIVIVDLPPMLGCDDTVAIMPRIDGVVLVVPSGKASYPATIKAVGNIPKEKLMAAVLNKVPGVEIQYLSTYHRRTN